MKQLIESILKSITFGSNRDLFNAVKNRNLSKFQNIINKGIDINLRDKDNNTPLLWACWFGDIDIVNEILSLNEVNINIRCKGGMTALMTAIFKEHNDIINILLLRKDIDIHIKDDEMRTAFFWAVDSGLINVVKKMIENDINVNDIDINGFSPLVIASYNGNSDMVKLLLNVKKISVNGKNNDGVTALIAATSEGNTEVVELLLKKKGIDINTKDNNGCSALIYAITNKNIAIVTSLLTMKGIDKIATLTDGSTSLMLASALGCSDIVKLLINKDTINIKGKNCVSALMVAITKHQAEIVNILLNEGAEINDIFIVNGYTPLMFAVDSEDINIIKILIEHCADINVKNSAGETALMIAIKRKNFEITQLLLNDKSNADAIWIIPQ